jgi:hypothetical protein
MEVDLDHFTKVLNTSAERIKEASEVVSKNPAKAMEFIPSLMAHFQELQTIGSFEDIKASVQSAPEASNVHSAIQKFLQNTKEAQEKVGPVGAALFGTPQFQELTSNLEQVKKSLERGKRVEGSSEGQEI